MATLLQAVSRYGPRVRPGMTIHQKELCDWMARGTGLNANSVGMTLGELGDAVVFFLQGGFPVAVPGLGRLRLTMDRHGELRLRFMADKALLKKVLDRKAFNGTVKNAERAKWTEADYKAAWEAEFPGDTLTLPGGTRVAVRKRRLGPGRPGAWEEGTSSR